MLRAQRFDIMKIVLSSSGRIGLGAEVVIRTV